MTDWKIVQGSQENKPSELDVISSAFYIYQRKNIERVTVKDEMSGETAELWQYEERKLTPEEYAVMRLPEVEDELTKTQLALVEMYEALL